MKPNQDWGFHSYIRGIILFGFAMLLLGFILTGNIRYYIAPKMMPFIYFATAAFIILGIVQILRSTAKGQEEEESCDCGVDHRMSGSRISKLLIYGIFIAPILMGFMIPDKALDSSVATNRGVQLGSGMYAKPAVPSTDSSQTPRADQFLENPDQYLDGLENDNYDTDEDIEHFTIEDFYSEEGFNEYYDTLAKQLQKENRIVVTEENYLDVMTVLDIYIDQFIGKELQIVGFVYREPDFHDDQFVAARFSMTCCVADAAVYGTMIQTGEALNLEEDTWVKVTGTIDKMTYNDFIIPYLHLRELQTVDEPEYPYVFPSFR
ncbi:TIGR03943 family putative permease subunit [Anaerobacillus sp. MEB173]|uniref:TIGR03943 family putative permease subunit n=1 Tax=Anaerobacillus sp. MEB173 TaxID=3383345 RepID=UPI003F8F2B91